MQNSSTPLWKLHTREAASQAAGCHSLSAQTSRSRIFLHLTVCEHVVKSHWHHTQIWRQFIVPSSSYSLSSPLQASGSRDNCYRWRQRLSLSMSAHSLIHWCHLSTQQSFLCTWKIILVFFRLLWALTWKLRNSVTLQCSAYLKYSRCNHVNLN